MDINPTIAAPKTKFRVIIVYFSSNNLTVTGLLALREAFRPDE